MPACKPGLSRNGETLVFTGTLDRAAAAGLWPTAVAQLEGARGFDLRGLASVDTAGLALLAELAARIRTATGADPRIDGEPAGLAGLRNAYRLAESLDYRNTPPDPTEPG